MWPFVHKGFLLTSLFKLPLSRCGMDHDIANVNEHPFQSKQKIVVFFFGGGVGAVAESSWNESTVVSFSWATRQKL